MSILKKVFLEYFAPFRKYTKSDFLIQLSNVMWIAFYVHQKCYFYAALFLALLLINEHLMAIHHRNNNRRQPDDPE